ncbi:hypothetical protein K432DRAFT_425789 [Lepidopterella palustris CBS 459.81]|uniref:Uncharacterized protein n=1 Tax=Lepidopterella palustris CBS 459.81 TaxID=1314670 RepID=A0A8E2EAB4_9PEZI|nr:hypothetical protein K432DRAFT_425789 [Lepidopterella palustris CBS 459.81]
MAPSPHKPAPTFIQTWDETDAAFLKPANLPLQKIPRAWDRKPQAPFVRDGRIKKVWRRHELRSQPMGKQAQATSSGEEGREGSRSPTRAVKKMRLKHGEFYETTPILGNQKPAFTATRWDRRKSVLPRKIPVQPNHEAEELEPTIEAEERETAHMAEPTSSSPELSPSIEVHEHHHSIYTDVAEASSNFSFSFFKADPESASNIQTLSQSLNGLGEEMIPIPVLFNPQASESAESMFDLEDPIIKKRPQFEKANGQCVLPQDGKPESITDEVYSSSEESEAIERMDDENVEMTHSLEDVEFSSALESKDESEVHDQLEPVIEETEPSGSGKSFSDGPDDKTITPESTKHELVGPIPGLFERPAFRSAETESILFEGSEIEQPHLEEDNRQSLLTIRPDDEMTARDLTEQGKESDVTPNNTEYTEEQPPDDHQDVAQTLSIADGLTLLAPSSETATPVSASKRSPRKLRSPLLPSVDLAQEDLTTHLDDDTAILKDFLTRAAASKANKAHKTTAISRRTSLSHRRDSDAIRHALASPRKILEDKDPNSPSPHKSYDNTATLDLDQTLTLDQTLLSPTPGSAGGDTELAKAQTPSTSSRRSTRARTSRIPHAPLPQPQTPKSIPVRRTDGGEPVVLRRTEAQELGILTRANTRKNKSGAVAANVRLLKLITDETAVVSSSAEEVAEAMREGARAGERKAVRWDETLVYFQQRDGDAVEVMVGVVDGEVENEVLDSKVEETKIAAPSRSKVKDKSSSTPRIRRLRGLGAANGTPGKGLLAPSSLLPTEVQDQEKKAGADAQRIAKPKAARVRKLPVKSADAIMNTMPQIKPLKLVKYLLAEDEPEGMEFGKPKKAKEFKEVNDVEDVKEVKERKSRLATPRKVKIPVPATPMAREGKENRLAAGPLKQGVSVSGASGGATGGVAEAGLPRRRAARRA